MAKKVTRKINKTLRAYFDNAVMVFGTSYRDWHDQLAEYCKLYKKLPSRVEMADVAWVSYGGLKWAEWGQSFQKELSDEGRGRLLSHFEGHFRPLNEDEMKLLNEALPRYGMVEMKP